jgi:hypothetical protein
MYIEYWWKSQKERPPHGKSRGRWVDNIKMDLRDIGWCGVDWINLARDREQWTALLNTVMKFHKMLGSS